MKKHAGLGVVHHQTSNTFLIQFMVFGLMGASAYKIRALPNALEKGNGNKGRLL